MEIPRRFILLYTLDNEIVFEPFAGNGTTIIAAQNLSRRCYAMEIEAVFCDVAVKRWEDYTGKKAELL